MSLHVHHGVCYTHVLAYAIRMCWRRRTPVLQRQRPQIAVEATQRSNRGAIVQLDLEHAVYTNHDGR